MKISVNSLFTDKRGNMYTVVSINKYNYNKIECCKISYYPVSDNGLVCTTKLLKCSISDIGNKYKLLNWKF